MNGGGGAFGGAFGGTDGGGAGGGGGTTGGAGGTQPSGGGTGAVGGGGMGATGGGGTSGGGTGGGTGATGGGGTGGGGTGGGGTGATGGGGTGGGTCTPPVAGGQCDTFPQCGCSGTQACAVTAVSGMTACVPPGTITPYNKCQNLNDCVKGYACVGSACKSYCEADADCTTGGVCFPVQYDDAGVSKPIPGMKVCSKKCKLENPAGACGAGLGCYIDDSTPPKTDCAAAGTSTGAGGCTTNPTGCAPGYACLTTGDCKKWCRVGTAGDCTTGTCSGFSTALYVDGVQYGVCQ